MQQGKCPSFLPFKLPLFYVSKCCGFNQLIVPNRWHAFFQSNQLLTPCTYLIFAKRCTQFIVQSITDESRVGVPVSFCKLFHSFVFSAVTSLILTVKKGKSIKKRSFHGHAWIPVCNLGLQNIKVTSTSGIAIKEFSLITRDTFLPKKFKLNFSNACC